MRARQERDFAPVAALRRAPVDLDRRRIAQAQTQTPPPANAPQLTVRDNYDRVEAAGYRNIREIEHEHGRYEVKAQNAQGAHVKLYVNATSGAVERTRTRD